MSQRVTWRSQPRSKYPWPLRTKETTVADLIDRFGDGGLTTMFGPLPLHAMVELIYRVKTMTYEASAEVQNGDWYTLTSSGTLGQSEALTESGIFQRASFKHETPFFTTSAALLWTSDFSSAAFFAVAGNVLAGHESEIYKTGPNEYWSTGHIALTFRNPENSFDYVDFYTRDFSTVADETFMITLILANGTYQIPCPASASNGPIRNSELTLTASEWWTYKTTDGSPAWDSSTGAPINGGPDA